MRVAIFTETYLPTINGVVTHVKTLKEGLEALGHDVLIVTADASIRKYHTEDNVMYCPAVRLKKIYNYDVASPISAERLHLIKEFSPDIIHIHNEFGVGLSGVMIAKLLHVPLVYTLHTMYDDYIYYVANKHFCKFVTSATHKYARVLAGAASAIIGPSQKVEEYFKRCGVKKPVNIISNTAELDKFNPEDIAKADTNALRKKLGFNDDDTVFCFCGRLGKEKNITGLLHLFAETVKKEEKLKLLIIGEGPFYEEHLKEAKELGIADLVVFTGRVEHVNLPIYYTTANAYITASLTENYSISMLEGMAMGLPVITIRDELNVSQVIPGVTGYIYTNAAEMHEFMLKIKNLSAEEKETFSTNIRDKILAGGPVEMAKNILEVYNNVIVNEKKKRNLNSVKVLNVRTKKKNDK